MYMSSVPDFIKSLYLNYNSSSYYGILEWSNDIHKFIFNNHIKDILKSYNNYYILIYHIDDYQKLYNYIYIDITHLLDSKICRCILISNEDYMLYKLSNI